MCFLTDNDNRYVNNIGLVTHRALILSPCCRVQRSGKIRDGCLVESSNNPVLYHHAAFQLEMRHGQVLSNPFSVRLILLLWRDYPYHEDRVSHQDVEAWLGARQKVVLP